MVVGGDICFLCGYLFVVYIGCGDGDYVCYFQMEEVIRSDLEVYYIDNDGRFMFYIDFSYL